MLGWISVVGFYWEGALHHFKLTKFASQMKIHISLSMYFCRSSKKSVRANSFLLCMASPVLHKMLCGSFREGATRRLSLTDVDGSAFQEVLNLWCGKEGRAERELGDVMAMASVADRLEMLDVFEALEAAIIGELRPEVCAEVLMSSRRLGLGQVEEAAWEMMVERFEEVSKTAGFMGLDEETVGKLLEEDGLGVVKEEEAFEGLVGWMKGDAGGGLRGKELLGKIRFGVMDQGYLEEKAREMMPEEHRGWMECLVGLALRGKAAVLAKETVEIGQVDSKALTCRRGRAVEERQCSEDGRGHRLQGHSHDVSALVKCGGRMCSGSLDGSIRVWKLGALKEEHVLLSENEEDGGVSALAVWEGQLISGYAYGKVQVWDMGTGERRRELKIQAGRAIVSLCVVGSRLASGSDNGSIKVWVMGQGWPCERTLGGHKHRVAALAGWEGKLISGAWDCTIRVWELETGRLDTTLTGHAIAVSALVVHGQRLYSAAKDGTIRVWAVGTWAAMATMEAYDIVASGQYPRCLAVSGSTLISGSGSFRHGTQGEVRLWDVDSLICKHSVREQVCADIWCLAAAGGAIWGGMGAEVVVWRLE